MNIRKPIIIFVLLITMIFTFSAVPSNTFAFWSSNVDAPLSGEVEYDFSIGEWQSVIENWTRGVTYYTNDEVVHNGYTYRATRTSTNREPGAGWFWWIWWQRI